MKYDISEINRSCKDNGPGFNCAKCPAKISDSLCGLQRIDAAIKTFIRLDLLKSSPEGW